MKNIPIQDFMDEHRACRASRRWVAEMGFATCRETFEALCNGKAEENGYDWAMWFATRPGVLSQRELVGLAAWCTRHVAHLLTDDRSIKALELAERFAAGEEVPADELKKAIDAACAARDAAWAAARDAAWAAARDAAWAAARDVAWAAARDAAWAAAHAAWAAVRDAAWAACAARDAAWAAWAVWAAWAASRAAADPDAECRAQLEHLREIVKFEEAEAAE